MPDWTWKQAVADQLIDIANAQQSSTILLKEIYKRDQLFQSLFPDNVAGEWKAIGEAYSKSATRLSTPPACSTRIANENMLVRQHGVGVSPVQRTLRELIRNVLRLTNKRRTNTSEKKSAKYYSNYVTTDS